MQTINDVHQQFASFFPNRWLKPFVYLVSKKLEEGHICIDLNDAKKELAGNPFYAEEELRPELLAGDPFVGDASDFNKPFVLHHKKLYLQRYFQYESQIIERLRQFFENGDKKKEARTAALREHNIFAQSLFPADPAVDGDNGQWMAAVSCVLNDFTIITGGPGTGKTTTVSKILAMLFTIDPELKVALAAPTGKAANRMAETLQTIGKQLPGIIGGKFAELTPSTIHRLLGSRKGSHHFRHSHEDPLRHDVVIVDESSMIDVALFAKLLDAIGPDTRLIMLGDKDQLASVEAGSMFGDLCNAKLSFFTLPEDLNNAEDLLPASMRKMMADLSGKLRPAFLSAHIKELNHSYRFSSGDGIGRFSKAIINSEKAVLEEFFLQPDRQVQIDKTYDETVFLNFVKGYKEYIEEKNIHAALTKLNALRVLCAVREGEYGVYAINRRIEKYLQQQKLIQPGTEFYENRPIIITRNYYELNLFNGDIGLLRYDADNTLKAFFDDGDGGTKPVLPGFLAEAETVFAMTIHKSQGSEYEQVLVIMPDLPDMPLLTAELLYTAVTRARYGITLQARAELILATVNRRVKRASGIEDRINLIM